MGAATLQLIDELGSEFTTDAPCQTTAARAIGREDDGELRRDFDVFRDSLDAASRDVRDGAVTRQGPGTDLYLRASCTQLAFGSPPIHKHCASSPCETTIDPSP